MKTETKTETKTSETKLTDVQKDALQKPLYPDSFAYAPIAKKDMTNYHIPVGGLTTYNPVGYSPNKHHVLLKTDFSNDVLYSQYKGIVHLPWYQLKIQS